MKRDQLEHIIRAAGAITAQDDLVVIGSQALLGQHPDAPEELLRSIEADVYPRDRPDLAIQIDGAIGELSPFHQTFGYYAHGVDETTATLPPGWKERLVAIRNENTRGVTGWCLEVHDLACSKLVAGRAKDISFIESLLRYQGLAVALGLCLLRCSAFADVFEPVRVLEPQEQVEGLWRASCEGIAKESENVQQAGCTEPGDGASVRCRSPLAPGR